MKDRELSEGGVAQFVYFPESRPVLPTPQLCQMRVVFSMSGFRWFGVSVPAAFRQAADRRGDGEKPVSNRRE